VRSGPGPASSAHAIACAFVIALAAATGCKGEPETSEVPPPPPSLAGVIDAGAPPDGVTTIGSYDPASGAHLDDDPGSARHAGPTVPHAQRTLEILLRSTPPGATVAVDGVIVGETPTYWEGDFTGREREFTFVMPGYAMARYRFVPITNGVVHGRLAKIVADQDAGVPVIPQPEGSTPPRVPAPPDARPPDAAPPPPPPPPDAAAPSFPSPFADAAIPP
jgi:PEGA domain